MFGYKIILSVVNSILKLYSSKSIFTDRKTTQTIIQITVKKIIPEKVFFYYITPLITFMHEMHYSNLNLMKRDTNRLTSRAI